MADHFEVRSWDNFVWWAKYLLNMKVQYDKCPTDAVRFSLYGIVNEKVNTRKSKIRKGHFLYLHYVPYSLEIPGSEKWKYKPEVATDAPK